LRTVPERRFALKAEKKHEAICCNSARGPHFYDIRVYDNCTAHTDSSISDLTGGGFHGFEGFPSEGNQSLRNYLINHPLAKLKVTAESRKSSDIFIREFNRFSDSTVQPANREIDDPGVSAASFLFDFGSRVHRNSDSAVSEASREQIRNHIRPCLLDHWGLRLAWPFQVMAKMIIVGDQIGPCAFVMLPMGLMTCHCRGFGGDGTNSRWRYECHLAATVARL
jgi:hypothetical protein